MPNLVGIGLSQVPTNSMLGGMAYQDPEHASIKNLDLKNLSQINSEISDTAVDIFVYDTRKDSDGGAWRKRTQNTSWYNETLGTATRGSRREFPAVAVIVAEASKVTIYDGDDPDLPLWMSFPTNDAKAITAINGEISLGAHSESPSYHGLLRINFVADQAINHRESNSATVQGYFIYKLSSTDRAKLNDGPASWTGYRSEVPNIVNGYCNDVVMTVLPNAPIDSATGLPVPTIAVATNGGVSVINDDGTVVQKALTDAATDIAKVEFTNDGFLIVNRNDYHYFVITTIDGAESQAHPSGYTNNINYFRNNATNYPGPLSPDGQISGYGNQSILKSIKGTDVAMADSYGLNIFNVTRGINSNNNMVAYITSSYNTGYLHGDIKGAFLSDTTVESLTANTNLASNVLNGGTNRLSSHTYDSGDTAWQMVDNASSANGYISLDLRGLTVGQSYFVSMTWDNNATLDSGYEHRIAHLNGLAGENNTNFEHWNKSNGSSETLTGSFVAQSVNDETLVVYANAITLNITNFNIRQVDDEDRSAKNKGLGVYGTITKSAVATGAELVAYSGFSASNYLQQPYNSDLAPGTAAYSVSCWFKTGTSSGDQYIFDRNGGGSGNSRNLLLIMNTSAGNANKFQWWHRDASGNTTDIQITDKTITDDVWHQVVAVNDGSTYKLYVDGDVSSITSSVIRNVGNDNNPPMYVGIRHTGGATFITGSMALFRYSKSAPSPEQVKKMYEDEKCLFHENAKATLYGSSDAVTALAFDDTTNLLHVGTSAGRSEFQGLRRINNTTTAVTTAISASNELVAEQ